MAVAKPAQPQTPDSCLNARQRAYLLALYEQDQHAEAQQRAAALDRHSRRPPARVWRAIEYGPRLPPDVYPDAPLRAALRAQGLVSEGSGATWSRLRALGFVQRSIRHEQLMFGGRVTKIAILHVALTRQGRACARALAPPAPRAPKRDPSELSASAWRLLLFAAAGDTGSVCTVDEWWNTGGTPPTPLVLKGLTARLAKLQLAMSTSWDSLAITDAGHAYIEAHTARYFKLYPYSARWQQLYSAKASA